MAYGAACLTSCPSGTFNNNGLCSCKKEFLIVADFLILVCTALDSYCTKCSVSGSCLGCSGGKVAYGASCYDKCPFGTKNDNGICVGKRVNWNFSLNYFISDPFDNYFGQHK